MAGSVSTSTENSVKKIYMTVIDEVIANVREAFLDDGYDEQMLHELKQLWESKLSVSHALQPPTSSLLADENTGNIGDPGAETSETRLPILPPQRASKNATNSSSMSANGNKIVQPSDANADFKPDLVGSSSSSSTLDAFKALPQSLYAAAAAAQQQQQHLQQLNEAKLNMAKKQKLMSQLDGAMDGGGSSSEDEDDDDVIGTAELGDDDIDDIDDKTNEENEYEGKEDPDPLNSEDDLTSTDSDKSNADLFDTDHVIVCQYDKITRIKNRWKFHLKDGIMNINGRDYLFSKATGDAEW